MNAAADVASGPAVPSEPRAAGDRESRLVRHVAAGCFAVLALVCAIKLGTHPYRHSSFFIYQAGAEAWIAGGTPYRPTPYPPEARIDEPPLFRYSPPFAAALVPFAAAPIRAASVAWVIGSLAAYFFACRKLFAVAAPAGKGVATEAIFYVVAFAGAIRPSLSGNAHVLSAAGMAYATAAAIEGRWWRAAFALPFPIFAKAAPLVFGGLLALARPFAAVPRFTAALLLCAAAPALVAGIDGAAGVYGEWFTHLAESQADRWPSFRDLWLVWQTAGIPFSPAAYRVLQAALGLATLALVVRFLRASEPLSRRVVAATGAAHAYLLLCGPAVEFTQFIVAAPWIGLAVGEAHKARVGWRLALAALVTTFALGNSPVERTLVAWTGSAWPKIACTLGIALYAAYLVLHGPRRASGNASSPPR